MFESSEFLDCYLPDYFEKVVSRFYSTLSPQKINLNELQTVSQLIKFSHALYTKLGLEDSFTAFLKNQFFLSDSSLSSKSPVMPRFENQKKRKIIETLESKLDKISISCIKLYIKILQINFSIKGKKLTQQKILLYSEQILNVCNTTRFQYEINRFQMGNLKQYDQYISNVFKMVFQEKISENMEQIIRNMLTNQCSNISDAIVNEIQSYFNKNKQINSLFAEQKCKILNVKAMLRRSAQKKLKNSPCKMRKLSIESIKSVKSQKQGTPNKKMVQKIKDPNSPGAFLKLKKAKPISKQRTIYFERKNIHVPKIKDWLEKMHCIVSQSTVASFEKQKKTQAKPFKFDFNQSTFDEQQSILVGSTPKKPMKKISSKMISQKLDF